MSLQIKATLQGIRAEPVPVSPQQWDVGTPSTLTLVASFRAGPKLMEVNVTQEQAEALRRVSAEREGRMVITIDAAPA